jgi:hypothetical protein
VANIPILRGLVTRWVFNFRYANPHIQKVTPEKRPTPQRRSSSLSEKASRRVHNIRMVRKLLPCIDDDFSSSLATPKRSKLRPQRSDQSSSSLTPSSHNRMQGYISYLGLSRRNSLDRYESASVCEKADTREMVHSIGSLGSAPTLVESTDMDWKCWDSSVLHAKKSSPTLRATEPFSPVPPLSPLTPLTSCRLKSALDGKEFDFDDDIWPYR